MKKLLGVFLLLALVATLVVACGGSDSGNSSNGTSGTGSNTVGLDSSNFAQSSITVSKGSSLTLTNNTGATHIVSNGTWNGNTPKPGAETGAPTASSITFSSANQSQSIGPFNTAGTFHFYCSVHPGMNLTVTVQ